MTRINESPLKNPDIENASSGEFSLGVIMDFSPLAAFWCQGSSNDSQYIECIFPKKFSFPEVYFEPSKIFQKTNIIIKIQEMIS